MTGWLVFLKGFRPEPLPQGKNSSLKEQLVTATEAASKGLEAMSLQASNAQLQQELTASYKVRTLLPPLRATEREPSSYACRGPT